MSIRDVGPLLGADEGLNHQIVDTFAIVVRSPTTPWTEKIWVIDREGRRLDPGELRTRQVPEPRHHRRLRWSSRAASSGRSAAAASCGRHPEDTAIGPIAYEVVDPLGAVRVRLEPNDVQPISFDLVLQGVTPPFFEDRNLVRNPKTNRTDVNVIRYHQGGWATGNIIVDGERYELTGEDGFGFRDHSWGIRQALATTRPTCRHRRRRRARTPAGAG